jgi:hypothetical protein
MELRSIICGGLVAVAVVGLTLPAQAAGSLSFDWNGLFSHRLDSREYRPGVGGTHTVTKTDADCPGPGDQMRVRLVRAVPWSSDFEYPFKTWNCTGEDQSRQWITEWNTSFHFTIEKNDTADTSNYWYVKGTAVYPS